MQQNGNCYSIFKKIFFCALMKRAADPLETGCSFFLSEACLFCAVILRTAEAQNRQTDGSEEEGLQRVEKPALAHVWGGGVAPSTPAVQKHRNDVICLGPDISDPYEWWQGFA